MRRRDFNTLKLERNAARAPIWAPRSGIPLQLALSWPEMPFHSEGFTVSELTGALGPTDLLVFTRVCTLYAAGRPSDRRVEVSLTDVARWSGGTTVGGSQRRLAIACLGRLRGATFTSSLRFGRKGSERLIRGWGLIDEWLMPEGGRHAGWVRLSAVMAELLDAGSVVLLDARQLEALIRRSGLAARLWVFLEAETLSETGPYGRGQPYGLFTGRQGEPLPQRARSGIADMCRLVDGRRSRSVLLLRRACEVIEEVDTRYRLDIRASAKGREGMWNLWARRWKQPAPMGRRGLWAEVAQARDSDAEEAAIAAAPWGMQTGTLEDATRAPWGMQAGTLGHRATPRKVPGTNRSVHADRAPWGMEDGAPSRVSPEGSLDGFLQTEPALPRRIVGSPFRPPRSATFSDEDAIARDHAILSDPDAPSWKREAALAHLHQFGKHFDPTGASMSADRVGADGGEAHGRAGSARASEGSRIIRESLPKAAESGNPPATSASGQAARLDDDPAELETRRHGVVSG